jgi:hypothetical protein
MIKLFVVEGHRHERLLETSADAYQAHVERLRLACRHLRRPHIYFLAGRAALTDQLWLKYGRRARMASMKH